MKIRTIFYIALYFSILGCASNKDSVNLNNTHWILEEFEGTQVNDLKLSRVPEFIFKENEKFSGNDGCNGIGGKYNYVNNKLEFSEVMGTKMYCEEHFDRKYNSALQLSTSTKQTKDFLLFYKEDVVILKFKKK